MQPCKLSCREASPTLSLLRRPITMCAAAFSGCSEYKVLSLLDSELCMNVSVLSRQENGCYLKTSLFQGPLKASIRGYLFPGPLTPQFCLEIMITFWNFLFIVKLKLEFPKNVKKILKALQCMKNITFNVGLWRKDTILCSMGALFQWNGGAVI